MTCEKVGFTFKTILPEFLELLQRMADAQQMKSTLLTQNQFGDIISHFERKCSKHCFCNLCFKHCFEYGFSFLEMELKREKLQFLFLTKPR
jgi:hypothetical protein